MPEHVSNNNFVSSAPTILPSRVTRFINDFTARVELQAARMATGAEPTNEVERQFQTILQEARVHSPIKFDAFKRNMAKPLGAFKNTRRFEAFAHLDVNELREVEAVDLVARHKATMSPFATEWRNIPAMVDGLVDVDRLRGMLVPQAGYAGLKFNVSKVQCIEETDEWGSDEIYLGGNFIDETGDVSSSYFSVSNDFDTGEVRNYGFPGKQIQYFNILEAGNKFPKIYTTALTMVEEDWGNMSGWFKDLFNKIKDKVSDLLKKLGYAVGQLIGLGEIGQLIGEIFAAIFKWLVGWIVSLFENDPMGTFTTRVTLNSYTGNWISTGGPILTGSHLYSAHGGRYRVTYAWELVK